MLTIIIAELWDKLTFFFIFFSNFYVSYGDCVLFYNQGKKCAVNKNLCLCNRLSLSNL